ncbi:hypothetical protein L1987_06460 [Smallanthus sonchifolius]|uniref:Uncharacterized protein n=1 Tax=Smallanthus sonchifolius TaxID=185202 RepID=A0ACB9JY64_9ASTR|nr:hypothetical protein L1987_06460 [Smallanthus sonchifolius]
MSTVFWQQNIEVSFPWTYSYYNSLVIDSPSGQRTPSKGTALYVVGYDYVVEEIKESVMDDMRNVMSRIAKSSRGVYVQASTLGSLV